MSTSINAVASHEADKFGSKHTTDPIAKRVEQILTKAGFAADSEVRLDIDKDGSIKILGANPMKEQMEKALNSDDRLRSIIADVWNAVGEEIDIEALDQDQAAIPGDTVEISDAARNLAKQKEIKEDVADSTSGKSNETTASSSPPSPPTELDYWRLLFEGENSRVSVNDLMKTFKDYDNSEAVEKALSDIKSSHLRRITPVKFNPENLGSYKKINRGSVTFTHITEEIHRKRQTEDIDRWMRGEQAFNISMVTGVSSNRFSFQANGKVADMLEEAQKYQFDSSAREAAGANVVEDVFSQVARLTPNDFDWMDHSGISALTLSERDDFYASMNTLFTTAGIDVDASRLGFSFYNSKLTQVSFGLDIPRTTELENQIKDLVNTYTGTGKSEQNDSALTDTIQRIRNYAARAGKINGDYIGMLARST